MLMTGPEGTSDPAAFAAGRAGSRGRANPLWRGVLLGLVLALATTLLAVAVLGERQRQFEANVEVISRQAGAHLAAWFDARFALAASLADRLGNHGGFEASVFYAEAATLLASTPGLLGINWVDTEGLIEHVYPLAGNELALGRNLSDHPEPDVARALEESRRELAVTRTRTIELFQGGTGFGIYWPVQGADGELLGFVNGVVRATELMAASNLDANLGDGYWLELRDDAGTVAWSNAGAPPPWPMASKYRVRIPGHDWILSVAPTPDNYAATVALPQGLLWLGISYLLALWVGWSEWRRQRRQRDLRASEQALRGLLDLLPHPIYVKDAQGRFRFVNRTLAAAAGQSPSQLIGRDSDALPVTEAERVELDAGDWRAMAGEVVPVTEVPFTDASGQRRWLEMARVGFLDPVNAGPAVLGIGVDVSARREAEGLRARIATALDQAGEAIAVLDLAGRVEFANRAFTEMMAFEGGDARGEAMDAFAVEGSDDHALLAEIRQSLGRGEVWKRRYTSAWADGERVRDATVAPFRDEQGRLAGFIGVLRDVTREEQLEQELRQSQKLEAVGRLSGGIAHDFNNLLTVILGYAESMQAAPTVAAAQDAAKEIAAAAERAAELTRQLLTFSRRGKVRAAEADLNATVRELMPMLARLIGEDITVEQQLAADLGLVAADRGEIEQIIVNLCVNARDALRDGGRIVVSSSLRSAQQAPRKLRARLAAGPYAVLAVTDNGVGMSPEVQARIFEPFFTTKDVGAGTGLGLSTVYGIAEQRGGAVHVISAVGRGSTLEVWLPLTEPAGRQTSPGVQRASALTDRSARSTGAPASPSASPSASRAAVGILVVEDEPGIRRFMVSCLEQAGYGVVSAGDGMEALEAAQRLPVIDLLITDIVMPRMGGLELRERLQAERGALRVLFVSGYAPGEARAAPLDVEDVLIEKPFRGEDLLQQVAACLDSAVGLD